MKRGVKIRVPMVEESIQSLRGGLQLKHAKNGCRRGQTTYGRARHRVEQF
jgi:hypothetical protein